MAKENRPMKRIKVHTRVNITRDCHMDWAGRLIVMERCMKDNSIKDRR